MKEKITCNKKKILKTLAIMIPMFIAIYIISNTIEIKGGDDMVYKDSFHDWESMIAWSKLFLSTWGGRVIVLGITSLFLNINLTIYKVCNALAILTLIYAIYKIVMIDKTEKKQNLIVLFFILPMLLLINQVEFNESIIWMTGSFNYLWTAMTLCITLIPFLKMISNQKISKWEYVFYIPATIFTCNFEQTGAIFVCFAIISILLTKIEKAKIRKGMIALTVLGSIVTIVSFSAVGNNVRYLAETIRFYPDFDMLSIVDKGFQGASITWNHLFNNAGILMLILTFQVCDLLFKRYRTSKTECDKQKWVLSFIPLGYVLIRLIPFNQLFYRFINGNLEQEMSWLYQYSLYNTDLVSNPEALIPIIIAASVAVFITILIYFAFEEKKNGIIYAVLYLAGICASIVMGFSPTIFASSQRLFFINDIMLIIVLAGLLYEGIKKKQYGMKEKTALIIIVVIGMLHLLKYV